MPKEVHEMHPDYAIWMVGGLEPELRSVAREREQRRAARESRRTTGRSWLARNRGETRSQAAETDLVCCPA